MCREIGVAVRCRSHQREIPPVRRCGCRCCHGGASARQHDAVVHRAQCRRRIGGCSRSDRLASSGVRLKSAMAAGNAVNRPNEAVYVSMALTRFVSSESSFRRRRANSCRPIGTCRSGIAPEALAARLENKQRAAIRGPPGGSASGKKTNQASPQRRGLSPSTGNVQAAFLLAFIQDDPCVHSSSEPGARRSVNPLSAGETNIWQHRRDVGSTPNASSNRSSSSAARGGRRSSQNRRHRRDSRRTRRRRRRSP